MNLPLQEWEHEWHKDRHLESLPVTYYICPNQFDNDMDFAEGVDVVFNDEHEAKEAAFKIARWT